jgi:hypothetical protein
MMRMALPEQNAAIEVALAHHGHCADQGEGAPPTNPRGNACEVQCSDGAPPAATPAIPFVALAALCAPIAPVAASVDAREWRRSTLAANSTAPPLPLQFCRLLI